MKKFGLMAAAASLGAMTAAERAAGRYMRAPDGHPAPNGKGAENKDGGLTAAIREHFDAIEQKFGPLPSKVSEAIARLDELEQKGARSLGPSRGYRKSFGQLVTEGKEAELSALANQRGRLSIEAKATITSATTDADGSAGDLIVGDRQPIFRLPRQRLAVRDLMTVIPVTSGSVEVPKQTGYTNAADTVAEGGLKPQSEMKFDLVNVPIRTIAHWVLASRQILDDVPQLQGLINSELRYGLRLIEEDQILNGGGTGTDLNGIYTQATAFSAGFTLAAPTMIDVIGLALLQNGLTDFPPDGVVMHPSDWMKLRLMKDGDGNYIMGPPGADIEPRIFGLPVALTKAMTADTFLVGNFEMGATLYDREEARVEVSTEDSDNFRKNLVTILAEERVGLAVKATTAFTRGDFSDAITAATAA